MTRMITMAGLASIIIATPALADEAAAGEADDQILVVGANAGTKTETPLIQLPQPIKVISEDQYLSQGAISISDTVKYAAGVLANPYGRDTRVDGFNVRGLDALQFRDGMRDIFSYYASITSDPYNFSRVEIVRGPASVLFGQGSIGGLVNLVSKTPEFTTLGEFSAVYGSYDRKELLGDVNYALSDALAVRLVGRARDADTYVDHVPDDRVMIAPSIRWQPTPDTDIVLTGLYQEDDSGSTSQFLPIVGTFRPNPANPAGKLDQYTFVGKAGWDRYSGRSIQGEGGVPLAPYKPQTGTQYEAGVKWQPSTETLVTVTAFRIKERNRVLYGANNSTSQSGELTTKGFEIEASHTLPGNFELLANYGYAKLRSEVNTSLDYMPRHTASVWSTKTFGEKDGAQLRLGAGVVYSGKSISTSSVWSIVTPSRTTVDALAEVTWADWRFALNATNLFDNEYYASCLARGDCFMGAPRNVMATVGYRF